MWQCINQTPGLSVRNAITRYPVASSRATSRRSGLLSDSTGFGSKESHSPTPCARIAKSWPWSYAVLELISQGQGDRHGWDVQRARSPAGPETQKH